METKHLTPTTSKRCMSRHGGQPKGVTVRESAAPLFIPPLTSLEPKSDAERLAEYRIKYAALTCKEAA